MISNINVNRNIFFLFLFLFSISLVNALTLGTAQVKGVIVGFDGKVCTGSDKVVSVDFTTKTVTCAADNTAAGAGSGGNTTQEIRNAVNASVNYIFIANQSNNWDTIDTFNSTQMEQSNNVLNILETWLEAKFTSFINTFNFIDKTNVVYKNESNVFQKTNLTNISRVEGDVGNFTTIFIEDDINISTWKTNVSTNWTSVTVTTYNATWSLNCNSTGSCQGRVVYLNYSNAGNLNITRGNFTIDQNRTICLNQWCSRYLYDNGTNLVLQG